jgi:ribonuclease BN (tRNA processing enzyme)
MPPHQPLDLTFLGSGNAFGADGRAYSSFILNQRYLFDCGPTLLPQLRKARLSNEAIDVVLISHFHADHFFGLPFLLLDGTYSGRTRDLTIVGPPNIEAQTEQLIRIGYANLATESTPPFQRRYVEISDGFQAEIEGLSVCATAVDHVRELEAFAYRVELGDRSLVYSGDTSLCDSLLRVVAGADVIVLECGHDGARVHLSPADVEEVIRHVRPGAEVILTHLDGQDHPLVQRLMKERGLRLASDLARFRF